MITTTSKNVNSPSSSYVTKSTYSAQEQSKPQAIDFKIPKPALDILAKKIKLKKSQYGVFSVMSYFIKFGFKEGCFIKQANYAIQLKKFGYKALRRQQVAIICAHLVELGLVSRIQRHRRAPYEYQLTELGESYYSFKNPSYQKQPEPRRDDWPDEKKSYIENDKNRTSQYRSSFNKTIYKNSWGKNMDSKSFACHSVNAKSQEQLNRDKNNEQRATQMAKEALDREGLQDPYKTALNPLQIDYDKAREYGSKLSSYTAYFMNSLRAN